MTQALTGVECLTFCVMGTARSNRLIHQSIVLRGVGFTGGFPFALKILNGSLFMATKFQFGDRVNTKFGEGTVSYVTPAERLGRDVRDRTTGQVTRQPGPQTYHVEIPHKGTFDFNEDELSPAPVAQANAAEPAPTITIAGGGGTGPAAEAHAPAAS
jgi:hypothetical protein